MHIESRPSKQWKGHHAFFVECDNTKGGLKTAIDQVKEASKMAIILTRDKNSGEDAGKALCNIRSGEIFRFAIGPCKNDVPLAPENPK